MGFARDETKFDKFENLHYTLCPLAKSRTERRNLRRITFMNFSWITPLSYLKKIKRMTACFAGEKENSSSSMVRQDLSLKARNACKARYDYFECFFVFASSRHQLNSIRMRLVKFPRINIFSRNDMHLFSPFGDIL